MAFQNHAPNGAKPSRFSTLKVFKLRSGSRSSSLDTAPPPPPPKDSLHCSSPNSALNPPPSAFYNRSIFNRSATSLSPSLSPDPGSGPATPSTPYSLPEFAKWSGGVGNINGRGTTASPVPSASGGSLRSISGGGGDHMPSPSMDGSTDSNGSNPTNVNPNPNANLGMYMLNGATSSSYTMGQASTIGGGGSKRRNIFKLANLARKNKSVKDLSDGASVSGSISRGASVSDHGEVLLNQEGDEGISMPWNFQHHIHVDEGYIGLPPSWSATLAQAGFDEQEIAAIHARRQAVGAAASSGSMSANPYTTYSTERPASPLMPATAPPTSTTTLLPPVPRLTSPNGQSLRIHTPSMYSLASSNNGGPSTIGGPSPAPSPSAPSFSMKSFMNGIKTSLTSDSSSLRDGAAGSRGEGSKAASFETNQYVFVNGDTPADENADRGMGDETLIDPYPLDAESVSSHHSHTSRHTSQSQTPRTSTFPQIQVQHANADSGRIPFPSNAARAPSPLAHSTSLPTPTPPRGYTYSNHSASPSPSHSVAGSNAGSRFGIANGTPRTPPRRIYHVSNASSDSGEEQDFAEPPPAYFSPKKGRWSGIREKDPSGPSGSHLPPCRALPPAPDEEAQGESSGAVHNMEDEGGSALNDNEDDITDPSTTYPSLDVNLRSIPETADGVLDISSASSSLYIDTPNHGDQAEMDFDGRERLLSPTPPLVIDRRLTKLATLPPRISFHQEGSLEDWSESLFSAIGKRSSVRLEKRATLRPLSPLAMANASAIASSSSSAVTTVPSLPDMSFGANLTLGLRARATEGAIAEGDEQEASPEEAEKAEDDLVEKEEEERDLDETQTAEETSKEPDESAMPPSPPHLPDVSLGPNVSSLGKDLGDFVSSSESTSSPELELEPEPEPEPELSHRASIDSLPPSPPPKPKPAAAPVTPIPPVASTLAPPRINTISNLSGKSPIAALFGAQPLPLPVPIPLSQIRAQLRPAPPKPPYPPPTIPLPPLKRSPPQPPSKLSTPPRPQPQLPLPPAPQDDLKPDSSQTPAPPDSRPSSSQTLLVRSIPGDRDSNLSTITVTPATIATAKSEVVRTAVANIVDSDTVSLVSRRDSVASDDSDTEVQFLEYYERDVQDESPEPPKREEEPDNSLISETSSVSLLRDSSQSTWPAPPPPPPVEETEPNPRPLSRFRTTSLGRVGKSMASHFSHRSSDTMSSSASESMPMTTPRGVNSALPAVSKTKLGIAAEARMLSSMTDTFGGIDVGSEDGEEESEVHLRPEATENALSESPTPLSPSLHPLLTDLQPYLIRCNPTSRFTDLVEIAEGESGSVFAARVLLPAEYQLQNQQQDSLERPIPAETSHVAIKRIPLPPPSSMLTLPDDSPLSNKLVSLAHELTLLKGLDHEHLLLLDAVYVSSGSDEREGADSASAVDTSLWIRMELMERSLADVIGLVAEGLALQERLMGRFANDILHGLEYLQKQHIAHRDVRSDNLLLDGSGMVKLADFSNAIRVDRNAPTVNGAVGVIYWQAPEMRAGPYDALKVDIWSLGATVWELAETVPPFSMPASPSTQVTFAIQTARHIGSQWPPLTHPEHYSRAFHEFMRLSGRESAARPGPSELLNTPFIRNACGRAVILQLLSQCRSLEEAMVAREAASEQS